MTTPGMVVCPNCGEENPEKFRMCGYCGTSLAPALPPQEERKTVTIVFSDLKGSTNLGEQLDAESLREVMTRYFDVMTAVLRRHGGTIEKFIGDAIMAVFGLPKLHEDDALRATRAAYEMTQALAGLNQDLLSMYGVQLANRTGVNTGEVVAGDTASGQRLVTGDAVNTAARLEQAAPTNEVLIGELTFQLVRDAVQVEEVEPLELKGKLERVPAYRLKGVADLGEGFHRRQDAPMVGREHEMTALNELYLRAREVNGARMATIIADAGVGKSRLIREFVDACDAGAVVVRGRCLPYGEGITFWPLVDAARGAAGIEPTDSPEIGVTKLRARLADDAVADRIAAAIGLTKEQFGVPEIFWATRKFLEKLADGSKTAIWVIDDIHWAEQTLLDLIVHMLTEVESPALILCSSRHDVLELHPDWALRPDSLRLVLQPLTDADAGQVVQNLLGHAGISGAVQERIVRAAEGNPLYVEQMLSMLMDGGQLQMLDGKWEPAADLSDMTVPPTIQALLAARLDRLNREERAVIEPASVIGLEFAEAAVEELAPDAVRPKVPVYLGSMSNKQLVRRSSSTNVDDASYRFMHILIKDAAYNGLLKRSRAQFHERFVGWADAQNRARGRSQEYEEILGYHLEQAYRYLGELGPLDEHGHQVGAQASDMLASAGRRAQARGDAPAAANLLRRAAATRLREDPLRLGILLDLAQVLRELGEFGDAERVVVEAADIATKLGDEATAAKARLIKLYIQNFTGETEGSGDWSSAVQAEVTADIPLFTGINDEQGLMLAWRLQAGRHLVANRYGELGKALEHVVDYARRLGEARIEAQSAYNMALALLYGPTPVEEAIPRCEELARASTSDQSYHALIQTALAQLLAMNGEFEPARGLCRDAQVTLQDLGSRILEATSSIDAARVETLAGDYEAAERVLRKTYGDLSAVGEKFLLSTVGGLLARVLVALGALDEADALTHAVEEMALSDDVDAQAIWRGVRARVLARRGNSEAALKLAREAVEMRQQSDFLVEQAEALMDLADVQRLAEDSASAERSRDAAVELLREKGDIVSERRLGSLVPQAT